MEYLVDCWANCEEEFAVHAPDRQDSALTDGVKVKCGNCGEEYMFSVDGDGEPSLDSSTEMGENISGPGAE